jgi:hypothetical protein
VNQLSAVVMAASSNGRDITGASSTSRWTATEILASSLGTAGASGDLTLPSFEA